MTAYVLLLGMAASYLIMKKQTMQRSQLEESKTKYNSAAKPAEPGPTSQEIRGFKAKVPDSTRFQDMSLTTPKEERESLYNAQQAVVSDVAAFENAIQMPEIQGVYFERRSNF